MAPADVSAHRAFVAAWWGLVTRELSRGLFLGGILSSVDKNSASFIHTGSDYAPAGENPLARGAGSAPHHDWAEIFLLLSESFGFHPVSKGQ